MKTNNLLTQYTAVRHSLEQERDKCLARAAEIEAALTSNNGHIRSASESNPRRGSSNNKTSLKEAVEAVLRLAGKSLDKKELLERVQKSGYRFTTAKPIGSLNAMLYSDAGKAAFRNHDGKFSAK